MLQQRFSLILVFMLIFIVKTGYAQSGVVLAGENNQFWTLPSTECDGGNFCEVRISPSGTITGWDKVNHLLYVSRTNTLTYEVYDLSVYSQQLVLVTDHIFFDNLGYVIFYSPVGASRSLTRFDLNTQNLDEVVFPNNYDLIGCNKATPVNQMTLRFIYQLDTIGRLVACTNSPQGKPTIHIINSSDLTIEQTLHMDATFLESLNPNWTMAAGLDGKIYVLVHNPEATINNLPQIDTASQEIILIYDVNQAIWSYKIKPKENTREILAVLSDGNIFFQNVEINAEILEFN